MIDELEKLIDNFKESVDTLAFEAYRLGYADFWHQFESAKLTEWKVEQAKKTKGKHGAIAGVYTYSVTPTTIGVVLKVTNNLTNESIDVTDYSNW